MEIELVETHPFGHLGPAPYRFIGVFGMPAIGSERFSENCASLSSEWSLKGIGGCYHCGTGIIDHYVISTGDGKHHAIGSTCIAKVQKASGLITKVAADMKKAKREIDRTKRHAREACQIEQLTQTMACATTREILVGVPHSRGFTDRETGEPMTALDEAEWMFKNAGNSGKIRLLKQINRTVARVAKEEK